MGTSRDCFPQLSEVMQCHKYGVIYRNTNCGSETQNIVHRTMPDIRMMWNMIQNDEIDGLHLQGPQVHITKPPNCQLIMSGSRSGYLLSPYLTLLYSMFYFRSFPWTFHSPLSLLSSDIPYPFKFHYSLC